ncbi:RICIN domain-containing protein [Streptomyces sp. NPDC003077]|uniref:RICIN domain-containing protein n=1 Tax=Streptomyces sp. NPDC003077 TaxID=3154443 RepID=UPI0033A32443
MSLIDKERTERSPYRAGKRGLRRLVALLATGALTLALLVAGGGQAVAAPPDTHRMATWNMQVGADRWAGAQNLARSFDVVALQEVPNAAPAGAFPLGQNGNVRSYLWPIGQGGFRYLYILNQPSRNLGIVTAWLPNEVFEIPGVYRSALAVTNEADNVLFASAHAASNGGAPNDAASLVRRVADRAFDEVIQNWVVLGDFNRAPQNIVNDGIPADALVYNSGQATQRSGNELDYLVSNVETENWQAAVNANYGSDHWPVIFAGLRAAAGPQELTIHADNSDRLLDVYQGNDSNGTHVIIYHANGGTNQRWKLYPLGLNGDSGRPLYRIVSSKSNKCLDVNRGQGSRDGDYLNIWACHARDGSPDPGGYPADTQNFTLEHPEPRFPNLTVLRDNGTDRFANVNRNGTGDGTWLIQWPYQTDNDGTPADNETFYLHPQI